MNGAVVKLNPTEPALIIYSILKIEKLFNRKVILFSQMNHVKLIYVPQD